MSKTRVYPRSVHDLGSTISYGMRRDKFEIKIARYWYIFLMIPALLTVLVWIFNTVGTPPGNRDLVG